MDKKTIISKTILFACIITSIVIFQKIFGADNTLIGVTIVTSTLMFMQRDLTANTFRFFVIFSIVNVFQGILAFITSYNAFLGVPATFISMFVTGYIFTYNMRSPMFIAFGLQYLFMLYTPVTLEEMPIRLTSLFSGAVIIMVSQIIINKNRLEKSSMAILPSITGSLANKIEGMICGNYNKDLDETIIGSIKSLRKAVHESRQSYFHTTIEGKINFNISIALERMNILVDRIYENLKKQNRDIKEVQVKLLQDIKKIVEGISISRNNRESIEIETNRIKDFINKYDLSNIINNDLSKKLDPKNIKEVLETMDFLEHNLSEVLKVKDKEYKSHVRKTSIPEHFRVRYVMKTHFNLRSLKFSYAFRSALLVTIGVFMVNYYSIPDGKWVVFTLFSIIQPYEEPAREKSWHRLKGTIFGIIIFIIIFSIVKDSTLRSLIIMLSGYISSYQKNYDREMICITFSALGVAAITGDSNALLAFYRGIYVILGIIIAMLANKSILPYRIKDGIEDLVNIYNQIIESVKEEISLASKGKGNIQNVRNLIMQTSLLEDRLNTNLSFEADKTKEDISKLLQSNRILINDLYDEYLGVHSKIN